jgi:3-deoxy-D-manno-octulosonic-acid transferase
MSARALYTLLLRVAMPLVVLRLWWRAWREPGYREHIAERFGHYAGDQPPGSVPTPLLDPAAPRRAGSPAASQAIAPRAATIWLHAVSVGEARAAAPLANALTREFPDHELILTCTTAAGRATLVQLFGVSATIVYAPYDLPECVQRFLDHFRPRLGVLMETEVWPNLLALCRERGLPLVLANARMSEHSARGYARWQSLTRPAFASLAALCAQSATDAERLRALGAREVEICGNLKFDVEPDAAQLAAGRAWRAALGARRVLLFASTREGEEALLLDALPRDAERVVILVPRHPRRFDEVARLVAERGYALARRSRGEAPAEKDALYLGDTLGEMAFYYAASDVAVIGGSFQPLGGQNLIEACAAGAPVIIGPSTFNFAEATHLAVAAGAAVQAHDAPSALRIARDLLANAQQRRHMAEAGIALCGAHRGATARHLAACMRLLRAGRGAASETRPY